MRFETEHPNGSDESDSSQSPSVGNRQSERSHGQMQKQIVAAQKVRGFRWVVVKGSVQSCTRKSRCQRAQRSTFASVNAK